MTYCLSIKIRQGLICLSDGRITSARQVTNARKTSLHGRPEAEFCIMTSGLRSLRDKTIAYLDRSLAKNHPAGLTTMLDAVDVFSKCLRQVAEEDRAAITSSDLTFDLHTIIGGQMPQDAEPTFYLVYPEGNWVEIEERTPYLSIGATAYGKPILDRALSYDTDLEIALKLAYLSFDSSRTSSADVGFPIDLTVLLRGERRWRSVHYQYDDLIEQRNWWNEHITRLAREMPNGPWVEALLPEHGAGRLTLVSDE